MSSNQAEAGTVSLPIEIVDQTVSVHPLIDSCPSERLARVVRRLCTEDAYLSGRLVQALSLTAEVIQATGEAGAETYQISDAETALNMTSLKRKGLNDVTNDVSLPSTKKSKTEKLEDASSTYAVCKNCNALFKHADNEMGDCVYHEGKS
jgi:hypothetical protein